MKKLIHLTLFAALLLISASSIAANYPFVNPTVSLSNPTAGALANYTFTQTTPAAPNGFINSGSIFTIVFPVGTSVNSLINMTYYGVSTSSFAGSGNQLTFVTPIGVPSNSILTIICYNITNGFTCDTAKSHAPNSIGDSITGAYYINLSTCTISVPQLDGINSDNGLRISPNPAVTGFSMSFEKPTHDAQVSIYTLQGALAYRREFEGLRKELMVDFTGNAGIYFIKVKAGGREMVSKLAVE